MHRPARVSPMFVSALLVASGALGGCAGTSAPPATPPPVVEIAAPADEPPPMPRTSTEPTLAADERFVVQCGVDDTPKSVVGERAPEPAPRPDGACGILLKPRFVPDPSQSPPAANIRPPRSRPTLVVPFAAPQALVSFTGAARSGHALAPALEQQLKTRALDIQACLGPRPIPTADLRFRVRSAASGAVVSAALLESPLEDDVSRCVVQSACLLSLPAGEVIDDLEVQTRLAPVAPVYRGVVETRATLDVADRANAKQNAALADIVKIVQPMAKECAKKSPPGASFVLPLRLTVYANRLGSQTPAMGGAVIDIAHCFVPRIGEAVGPLAPSLRKEKYIRVEVRFDAATP